MKDMHGDLAMKKLAVAFDYFKETSNVSGAVLNEFCKGLSIGGSDMHEYYEVEDNRFVVMVVFIAGISTAML